MTFRFVNKNDFVGETVGELQSTAANAGIHSNGAGGLAAIRRGLCLWVRQKANPGMSQGRVGALKDA